MPVRDESDAPSRVLLWSAVPTGIGDVVAVASPVGLRAARIGATDAVLPELAAEFAGARLVRDDDAMADLMRQLQELAAGVAAPALPLDVTATSFQARVWAALRVVPRGRTTTYRDVARAIGAPGSVRAVGRACATNPVALAIPCHRVLRSDGSLAGYRWGLPAKRTLLALESGA